MSGSDRPSSVTAQHLRAQRDQRDPVSQARAERVPERDDVIEVLARLREILLDRSPSETLSSDLEVVHGLLSRLTRERSASSLLETLPEIRHCLGMDVEAAYHGDPASQSYAEIIEAYPSILAISTYRIAHSLYQLREPVVARVMSEWAHGQTGIDIHPGASIGCHFFIDHGTGVVIGETTVIGNRVKLYHGVTLGAFSNRKGREDVGKKRHPTLQDDVTIYPNATILGGETVIGEGSTVGGNVWLTRSVPAGTRVAIEAPRLIQSADGDDLEAGEQSLDFDI